MTGKELSIVLRELACNQPTPLCKQWTEEWKDDTDFNTLVDKFVRGQDFCIQNNYPPLDFIRKNVSKEDLHRHNIYIDEEVNIESAISGYYIFLGKCTGSITANGYSAVTIYVRHESKIDVTASGAARVFVSYYENSDGNCINIGYSKLRKYDRRKKEG